MNKESGDITYGADEYARTKKESSFRTEVEMFTIFSLLGNPKGQRILDAGCGDGVYARELIDRGAKHVIGVDGAEDFIELAKSKNKGYEDKIEYHQSFIQDFPGNSQIDAIIGSYIMSYPRNLEEATAYCVAMNSHLKKGGRFIGFNNNPFELFYGEGGYSKYGFEKQMTGNREGSEVIYKVQGMENPIINFYLSPDTYEEAFEQAGFSEFTWKRILLDPSQEKNNYWDHFFNGPPPFIAMLAKK